MASCCQWLSNLPLRAHCINSDTEYLGDKFNQYTFGPWPEMKTTSLEHSQSRPTDPLCSQAGQEHFAAVNG